MKQRNKSTGVIVGIALAAIFFSFSAPAIAVDDGARAYWKARDGTNVVSIQYLFLDMQATGTQTFAPSNYIYPNSDAEASIFLASYARHFTLFDRPSSVAFTLVGGSVDVNVDTNLIPAPFLPGGIARGASFNQSATGFGDPSVQFDINLFGTPPLISTVDLLNYEPTWTIDAAVLLAAPIGQYDGGRLVNMGLNRFFGRVALPAKYHFGAFAPGYMTSIELTPSVWLFDKNDDFLGQSLENQPLWQLEGHVTHDFTRSFSASVDMLYRRGFQSEINGVDAGDELEIGNLGFTVNFQVTHNLALRAGFSSNVFGDGDLDNSVIRLQLVYGWHRLTENMTKLLGE